MANLHTNCQNKSQKYMYCMTTAEYEKEHLEKIACSISQLHWLWSLIMAYMLQDLARVLSLTQYTKIKISQPNFFSNKLWHSSNFEVKIGLNYCNIFVQQLHYYYYNVGKYQYNVSQQAGKIAGSFGFKTK